MSLLEQLRRMPPGSLVPRDWLLAELERGAPAEPAGGMDPTIAQVATECGRSPSTVRNWLSQGLLPGAYRLRGREWRIPRATLAAFLEGEAREERSTVHRARGPQLSDWRRVRAS